MPMVILVGMTHRTAGQLCYEALDLLVSYINSEIEHARKHNIEIKLGLSLATSGLDKNL